MEIKYSKYHLSLRLYSFKPILRSTLQPNPNNLPNTGNDILDMLATTKNEPRLIISITSKKVLDREFLTTIQNAATTTSTLDDHQNQNKNGYKMMATTMNIPSLGSNTNVSDNNTDC